MNDSEPQSFEVHKAKRDLTSVTSRAKAADNAEVNRLRCEVNNRKRAEKTKAEKAATAAALLQLPVLFPPLVVASPSSTSHLLLHPSPYPLNPRAYQLFSLS